MELGNFAQNSSKVKSKLKSDKESSLSEWVKTEKNNDVSWEVIKHIKQVSGMPVFAKGISCAEDTLLCLENGADAVYVSNHGARQLDTTPTTVEVLAECVQATEFYKKKTGSKVPILFDGGVRSGSDVLKVLSLGADIVFIGRPILWGLSCGG